ncbi:MULTISPECIES: 2OG-Fe(II) oxygenase [unclassified Rhizobacter]|uniref:2OG-Fe(II) oxygenase n=1 Tax=unclassified Rhizobacter TaxID=2640088 RepID=UPI0006FA5CE3|nr:MULTISPECIES: 2OG-Fe(II) oxygenase [unclassified Rhizobacter]KQU71356.1 proline dioxygenase [Rhizobacter sp. Root29]KQW10599.1 proline dioxygenase [Rhizobacter sp. Root1238]KRB24675.1 proline dioxygenase [Rhizobacter sp. Root16D2]
MNSTTKQNITPELRQWIVDQAKAGRSPDDVLKSMIDSGWTEDVAIDALENTLQGFLKDHAKANGLPVPVPVPEPDLLDSPGSVVVDGHEIKIVMAMRNPRVVVFGGLMTEAECDELVAQARQRLARSETVVTTTGASEVNVARTSEGMFFGRAENPICARVEERIAKLLNWPLDNGEGLQILRYQPGAEYKPHYDYFDPAQPGTPTILKRGGQRVGTLVVYLNSPKRGGATTFPDVHLEVSPVKGNAVFFSYDRPHPMTRTLHGGAPVLEGEKWVATKWMREGKFE